MGRWGPNALFFPAIAGCFFWPLRPDPACGSLLRNVTLHPGPRTSECNEEVWGGSPGVGVFRKTKIFAIPRLSAGAASLSGRFGPGPPGALFCETRPHTRGPRLFERSENMWGGFRWAKFVERSSFSHDVDSQNLRLLSTRGGRFCRNSNFCDSPKTGSALPKQAFFLCRDCPGGALFCGPSSNALSRRRALPGSSGALGT